MIRFLISFTEATQHMNPSQISRGRHLQFHPGYLAPVFKKKPFPWSFHRKLWILACHQIRMVSFDHVKLQYIMTDNVGECICCPCSDDKQKKLKTVATFRQCLICVCLRLIDKWCIIYLQGDILIVCECENGWMGYGGNVSMYGNCEIMNNAWVESELNKWM